MGSLRAGTPLRSSVPGQLLGSLAAPVSLFTALAMWLEFNLKEDSL